MINGRLHYLVPKQSNGTRIKLGSNKKKVMWAKELSDFKTLTVEAWFET
jgi:hypothetical protein